MLCGNVAHYSRVDDELATVDCDVPNAGPTWATPLVASQDVTILVVRQLGDDDWPEDYGHADLMTGFDAASLVWRPILEWIRARP